MPGIHIQTLSKVNWLKESNEKESLLTIPGSYWLCHKKNIYKFIFRYHRTMRNTIQFSYGRELLKIIRRIIKCHPTQGQQFGTQHLLVTYNCTSWTRQDKMFAILKFQQRNNAATFSHAFVLTIKICLSSEQSLFNLKYPIVKEVDADATFQDLNNTLDIEKKGKIMIHTSDKISTKKSAICQGNKLNEISEHNVIEDTLNKTSQMSINSNPNDNIESLDARVKNATSTIKEHLSNNYNNTKLHNANYTNESMDCNAKIYEGNIKQCAIDHREVESSRLTIKKDKIKRADEVDEKIEHKKMQEKCQDMQNIQKCKVISLSKTSLQMKNTTGLIKDSNINKFSLLDRYDVHEISTEKEHTCVTNNKDLDNKKIIYENINSSNVPYQHFINKEIIDTKYNTDTFLPVTDKSVQKNLQLQNISEIKNVNKEPTSKIFEKNNDKLQEHYKQHTQVLMDIDENQIHNIYNKSYKARKQKNKESERKTVDDKVLRSSNITDLVMEGLMFTIRQDRDSVAVIEQKTKLEVDEVLENSEKVETEAGEKCLLNSSLLRLENLITMIDSPCLKDQQHNSANYSIYSSPFNIFGNNTVYNLDKINCVNKESTFNYVRHKTIDRPNSGSSPSQYQHTYLDITNSNNCRMGKSTIGSKELVMDWEDCDNEQNRKHENEMKTEEKEDIPEIFRPTFLSNKTVNTELQVSNLLTDDKQPVCNISLNKRNGSTLPHLTSDSREISIKEISASVLTKSELIKKETNVPRVISDKIITVEQMPLALQKVLRHTCKKRRSSFNSESLTQKTQCATFAGKKICKANVTSEEWCTKPSTQSKSSALKIDLEKVEKTKNNENKLCITSNKNTQKINDKVCTKNMTERSNKIHRVTRTVTSLKNNLSRKVQDITEDFYYDLQMHNKDNVIRQRCLRQKRISFNNPDDTKNGKMRIEMLKFIRDMTKGAKVVLKRLNINNKSLPNSDSALAPCIH